MHGASISIEVQENFIYPVDVVLKNLATICKEGANPGPLSSGSFVFDLKANGVATGLQTLCNTSTWVSSDTTHTSPVVTAGQLVTLRSTPASAPFPNVQAFSSWQTFAADGITPRVFIEGGGFSGPAPIHGQYCDIMKGLCDYPTASAAGRVVSVGFTVDRFAVTMANAPNISDSEAYCLHNVTTGADIVCTAPIAPPARTIISPPCSSNCNVIDGDEIAIRIHVVGSGRLTRRHFAIHVTGASTQILFSGISQGGITGAGPIGLDFLDTEQLAVVPVATTINLGNFYTVADSTVTRTLAVDASSDCDQPATGPPRPTCSITGATWCADTMTNFVLEGIGCLRISQAPEGTAGVRFRGGVELTSIAP